MVLTKHTNKSKLQYLCSSFFDCQSGMKQLAHPTGNFTVSRPITCGMEINLKGKTLAEPKKKMIWNL